MGTHLAKLNGPLMYYDALFFSNDSSEEPQNLQINSPQETYQNGSSRRRFLAVINSKSLAKSSCYLSFANKTGANFWP